MLNAQHFLELSIVEPAEADIGGLRKSSKVVRGDYFSEVTFKGGIS